MGKDPKSGNEVAFIMPPTVPVSAGPFGMGRTNPFDAEAHSDGPTLAATTDAFEIARYPVTVAEYACFVRAGWNEPPSWQNQLKILDHPVVYVSWHDATSYAAWLASMTGQPWRLPTEEEWEKAARWDPRSGRSFVYPWGDVFDAARCNTRESGIGTTTPVGWHGAVSASPCGAQDMAGNVWEWTNSTWDDWTQDRVRRGGSWDYFAVSARTAFRFHNRLDVVYADLGFRVALAPARAGS